MLAVVRQNVLSGPADFAWVRFSNRPAFSGVDVNFGRVRPTSYHRGEFAEGEREGQLLEEVHHFALAGLLPFFPPLPPLFEFFPPPG